MVISLYHYLPLKNQSFLCIHIQSLQGCIERSLDKNGQLVVLVLNIVNVVLLSSCPLPPPFEKWNSPLFVQNRIYSRMFCLKFYGNWFSGSEEAFLIPSVFFVLSPLYPRPLCAEYCWNWASDSEKGNFRKLMYFYYLPIISFRKMAWPIIWKKPLCIPPSSLAEIVSVVLEKKMFKHHYYNFPILLYYPFERGVHLNRLWIPLTLEYYEPRLVKIGPVVLEEITK